MKTGRGIQTYYGYSLYHITATEYFPIFLCLFLKDFPWVQLTFSVPPILNSLFVTSFFSSQLLNFLSGVDNYQIRMPQGI